MIKEKIPDSLLAKAPKSNSLNHINNIELSDEALLNCEKSLFEAYGEGELFNSLVSKNSTSISNTSEAEVVSSIPALSEEGEENPVLRKNSPELEAPS